MQIEDLYQKIGQIVFSCGPDNATGLYVKATLFPEEDGGEFEFDYLDADSEPDWFEPDPLAVADLSDALRELQRIFIEENTNRGMAIWTRCSITVNVAEENIDIDFQYE